MMKTAMTMRLLRKPDQEIEIKKDSYRLRKGEENTGSAVYPRSFQLKDSMVLGRRPWTYSATFYEEEERRREDAKPKTQEELDKEAKKEKRDKIMMGCTVAVSICLAVAIFYGGRRSISRTYSAVSFLPILLCRWIEGVIRIGIFVLYVTLIAQMKGH